MGRADFYDHGNPNKICDGCGQKYKASELRETWDHKFMCSYDWEQRQPQDLLKAMPDNQSIDNPRPEGTSTSTYWEETSRNILNFMKCDEQGGTDASTEAGAVIREPAGLGSNPNFVKFSTDQVSSTPLQSGSWQIPASGSSLIIMMLVRINDEGNVNVVNMYFGDDGPSNIHLGGSSNISMGIVGNVAEWFTTYTFPVDQLTRCIWVCNNGIEWGVGASAAGVDVSIARRSTDDAVAFSAIGEFDSSFTDNTNFDIALASMDLYGMQWIEFPDGLPSESDYLEEVNSVFTEWEAGNKIEYSEGSLESSTVAPSTDDFLTTNEVTTSDLGDGNNSICDVVPDDPSCP